MDIDAYFAGLIEQSTGSFTTVAHRNQKPDGCTIVSCPKRKRKSRIVRENMPGFTTISPTSVAGKKEYAWRHFLEGGYVAIGWLSHVDLTNKSIQEIDKLLEDKYPNEPGEVSKALRAFERFMSLKQGDYVAVPNVSFGLFGVGLVRSGYKFKEKMHEIGSEDKSRFYSHYREVEWLVKDYHDKSEILLEGEKCWEPFGTIGKVQAKVPSYIARLIGLPTEAASPKRAKVVVAEPEYLKSLLSRIEALRQDSGHQERDHESLVEDFFVSIGYRKQTDLKFRRGRIDLTIAFDGSPLAVVEVKRTWDLDFESATKHIKQAYEYAHETGTRHVLVTNGDDYILFDRLKGLSWESNLLGEWRLSDLREEDIKLIDRLRPERLRKPNLAELFQYLSEAFGKDATVQP